MSIVGPIKVDEIIKAFRELGSEVAVGSIKERVILRRGGIPAQYKDEKSCKETIQRIIENHCPESDNYREERIAYFRRVDRGVYQLLPKTEWRHETVDIKPKKPHNSSLKRENVIKQMSQYYREHKSHLPASIKQQREKIIELLMDGIPVEEAFNRCIDTQQT